MYLYLYLYLMIRVVAWHHWSFLVMPCVSFENSKSKKNNVFTIRHGHKLTYLFIVFFVCCCMGISFCVRVPCTEYHVQLYTRHNMADKKKDEKVIIKKQL